MEFKSLMHISFYTANYEAMRDFYVNKMGLKEKLIVRYKEYLGNEDRPLYNEIAQVDPERIFYTYIELAPNQFIEIFPELKQDREAVFKKQIPGYSHFALVVDDIYQIREEFILRGITPDTEISKGPSGTYQLWFHDPDGNRFEVMQYTETSYQIVGHFS